MAPMATWEDGRRGVQILEALGLSIAQYAAERASDGVKTRQEEEEG